MTSYNLIDEPWLHVMMHDGETKHVGLRELFVQAHEIRDILTTHRVQRLAILHVLTAITMRAFPDWETTWEAGKFDPEQISEYLKQYEGRFDLLGDTPFYQVRDLSSKASEERPVIPIAEMPLYRHVTTRELGMQETVSLADAAALLITANVYSPTGRALTVSGYAKNSLAWTTTGFLAMGDSIFATIMLNTVPNQWASATHETDLPRWERPLDYEEDVERVPDGVADYLTYASRYYELVIEDDRVVGYKQALGNFWKPEHGEELMGVDPFSLFKKSKDGNYYRDRFQSRTMSSRKIDKKNTKRAYIPRGILGGLFILYTPHVESVSLVHNRVQALPSHWDRFVGYEVARLLVDESMGALLNGMVEEGLRVAYRLEAEPEVAMNAVAVMEDVFALQYEFESGLRQLLTSGMLEEANATMSHFLAGKVRTYISQGAREEEAPALLDEVARFALNEFEQWCTRVPVSSWQENYKATWRFTKTAYGYLKKPETPEVEGVPSEPTTRRGVEV